MNFFQKLFPVLNDAKKIVVADRTQYIKQKKSLALGGFNGDFDLNKSELISTVYTCISILASNVSRLPLNVFDEQNGNKKLDKGHYYFTTLKYQPNSYQSYQNWISLIVSHLFFTGNAYALIADKELIIVNPDAVSISFHGGKLWYLIDGFETPFRSSEILHFKLLSKDGVYGLNPVEALKSEINLQYKSERTVDRFYSNSALSTRYMEADLEGIGNTTKEKLKEYVDKFKEESSGYENSGNLIVIPPMYRLKELKLSASDIDFLQTANYTESSIAALFGIPTFLLGKSNSNYTNFEQQQLNFKNNTLAGVLNIIRAELEMKLLSIPEKVNGKTIEFDLKGLLDTDITTKANVAKTLWSLGAQSSNEIRKDFNMERVENEAMDQYYTQMQYTEIGTPPVGLLPPTNNNQQE